MPSIGNLYVDAVHGTLPIFERAKQTWTVPGVVGTGVRYGELMEPKGTFQCEHFTVTGIEPNGDMRLFIDDLAYLQTMPGPYQVTNDLGQFWETCDILKLSFPKVIPVIGRIPRGDAYINARWKCDFTVEVLFLT